MKPLEIYNSDRPMLDILKELYEFYLDEADQAKLNLIQKYREFVSYRLIREAKDLIKKGKRQGKDRANRPLENLVYRTNPFFAMLPKEPSNGKYFPAPLVLG